jgi:hypothetical protein
VIGSIDAGTNSFYVVDPRFRQALGCRRCQISRPCAVPSVEASTVRIRYSAVTSIPALLPSTNSRSARGGTHVNECNRLLTATIGYPATIDKEQATRAGFFDLPAASRTPLGFLQDGDVGVGVFPEGEEIIVGGECPDAGNIGIRSLRRNCSTDRRRRW